MRRCIARLVSVCLFVPLVLQIAACGNASSTITLNVFAAASLNAAFTELGTNFEHAHPGVTVAFNFAGSQQLALEIGQGSPADVFASANMTQMQTVIQSGQVAAGTKQVFVKNRLLVITPKDNPAHLQTLQDLAKPGLKLILADSSVPVGQYALQFLETASGDPAFTPTYKTDVLHNVVSYEQNVQDVFAKVQLGEADAGIVYTSDVANHSAEVGQIAIPDALNVIATYPIAPTKGSAHGSVAQQFISYVLSADGQAILAKYGFISVNASALVTRSPGA